MKSFQCDIQSCSSSKENDQELKLVTSIISLRLKLIYMMMMMMMMMMMKNLTCQGQIPDPTHQNCVLGNSGELLVGI